MRLRKHGYYYTLLIPLAIGLFIFISRLRIFIQLFFQHAGLEISQEEVAAAAANGATDVDLGPQQIPKILHQIYHDWHHQPIPDDWSANRQTCMDTNSDWDFMLWTEESSRNFLIAHYPWFVKTYDNYPHPVQRVDTIKYFLMLYYGGIYLDMDNTCLTNLTPLLYYPTWVMDGGCGALSNNILASAPNHTFWQYLTDHLIPYSYNYFFPYITISYASGQWFETLMWDAYHQQYRKGASSPSSLTSSPQLSNDANNNNKNKNHATVHRPDHTAPYRVKMDERPGMDPWVFFGQERGGSWNSWDNVMFLWIGDHLILLTLMICGVVAAVVWIGSRLLTRLRLRSRYRRRAGSKTHRYSPQKQDQDVDLDLDQDEEMDASGAYGTKEAIN